LRRFLYAHTFGLRMMFMFCQKSCQLTKRNDNNNNNGIFSVQFSLERTMTARKDCWLTSGGDNKPQRDGSKQRRRSDEVGTRRIRGRDGAECGRDRRGGLGRLRIHRGQNKWNGSLRSQSCRLCSSIQVLHLRPAQESRKNRSAYKMTRAVFVA